MHLSPKIPYRNIKFFISINGIIEIDSSENLSFDIAAAKYHDLCVKANFARRLRVNCEAYITVPSTQNQSKIELAERRLLKEQKEHCINHKKISQPCN